MKKSPFDCNKIKFSYDEARKALQDIQSEERYNSKLKQEKRVYHCPICKAWHLTSIDQKRWNKIIQIRDKARAKRIHLESEYWKNKFNIED